MKAELNRLKKLYREQIKLWDVFTLYRISLQKELIRKTPIAEESKIIFNRIVNHFQSISYRRENFFGQTPLKIGEFVGEENEGQMNTLYNRLEILVDFTKTKINFFEKNMFLNRLENIELPELRQRIKVLERKQAEKVTVFLYNIKKIFGDRNL